MTSRTTLVYLAVVFVQRRSGYYLSWVLCLQINGYCVNWLQFSLLDVTLPVILKFPFVLVGSLVLGWLIINFDRKFKATVNTFQLFYLATLFLRLI